MKIERHELNRLIERFNTRSKTIAIARLCYIFASVIILLGYKNITLNFISHFILLWILFIALYSVIFVKFCQNATYGRYISFFLLNLDLLWLLFVICKTGYLQSPALALELISLIFFVLIFPKPITLISPLLVIPIVGIVQINSPAAMPISDTISIILLYMILNYIIVHVVIYCLSKEQNQSLKLYRLQKHLKTLAITQERNRISREIHDGVGAALANIVIQIEYATQIVEQNNEIKSLLKELKFSTEEAMDETRRAVSMMRNDFVLQAQLKMTCDTFSLRHKIPVSLKIIGPKLQLAKENEFTIFRILQECLTNIAKHAKATQVIVQLKKTSQAFILTVSDNGIGFDPNNTPKNHYGLQNLYERAKIIKGKITVDSGQKKGTTIKLFCDLDSKETAKLV